MKKEDVPEKGRFRIDFLSVGLFFVLLMIAIVFFYLLNNKTGSGFGIMEIIISLVFAFVVSALLFWSKTMMVSNAYMGAAIGVFVVILLGYGFTFRYAGTYSTIFMIITGAVILVYLGINFFKYKSEDKPIPHEFDEEEQ